MSDADTYTDFDELTVVSLGPHSLPVDVAVSGDMRTPTMAVVPNGSGPVLMGQRYRVRGWMRVSDPHKLDARYANSRLAREYCAANRGWIQIEHDCDPLEHWDPAALEIVELEALRRSFDFWDTMVSLALRQGYWPPIL